ncbi:minichromosome maintenance protein 10 [Trypanosoma grayi]|uniref:minichromosome maintenance protein 10 n=1 Tax=Trypanosoma grayi TaxID=71804 RepID=UPI0004F4BB46|nr:minichromosome maintenance protein 10 [Trypanosoma grayi]KEG12693.1 minichromosome maintenance protein 10 [Trypanosoma grayi]
MAQRNADNDNNNNSTNDDGDDDDDPFAVFNAPASSVQAIAPLSTPAPLASGGNSGGERDVVAAATVSRPLWGGSTTTTTSSVSIAEALSKAAPATSASIMSVVCASSQADANDDESGGGGGQHQQKRARAAVMQEANSGINVSRPTKSCEQLPVVLAQHPFCTFVEARRRLAAGGSAPSVTVVGVVIRKTDPKQKNGKHMYGVISLWNMRGPFPTSSDELPVLFGGSAFDVHYTKLANAVVLALSGVQRMESRSGPSVTSSSTAATESVSKGNNNNNNNSSSSGSSEMLKVVSSDQVRVLGFAADLGTCQGVQQRSGERCNGVVNIAVSKYCSHHVMNLRREARGGGSMTATKSEASFGAARPNAGAVVAGVSRMNLAALTSASATSKSTRQMLSRQQAGFLTVKGSCGLPTSSPADRDVRSAGGAYAGVVMGGALPITGMCRNVASVLRSPQALGVTGRGRAVLAAAVDQEDAKETQRLLQLALGVGEAGVKRLREETTMRTAAAVPKNQTAMQESEEVRAQYAPLAGGHASTAFVPMRSSGFDEVLLRQQDYQQRVVTTRADGTTSSIVSTVERRLRSEGVLAKSAAALAERQQQEQQAQHESPTQQHRGAPKPASLLGMVAGAMQSKNDDLRGIDARRQFEQRMDRRIAQEKALDALSEVSEQTVKGLYCRQCERWYLRRNERCRMLQHTMEARETTRRFIECEHCGYKTSVLGDVRPSKIIPRCPRCCADVVWRASNAAPELAAPRDLPPPL